VAEPIRGVVQRRERGRATQVAIDRLEGQSISSNARPNLPRPLIGHSLHSVTVRGAGGVRPIPEIL
jgi:hypothetical protein